MQTIPVTISIKDDGTYETTGGARQFTGNGQIIGGKIRWKHSTGENGTWILHEGSEKRVLTSERDDGSISAEVTPAK